VERDLHDVLRAAADTDAAALAQVGTEGPWGRALSGVRRRRRVRHARQTVLGVAAVAVGVAVVLVGNLVRPQVEPAVTPSPHVTTSPRITTSPQPSTTPTPVPTTPPVALIEEPGLPPYRPLTPDVLATAGVGWVVSQLDLREPGAALGDAPVRDTAVFVSSPAGEVYRAADPDPSALGPETGFSLERWPAGASFVVVSGSGEQHHRARLDLLTGAVTDDSRGLPDQVHLVDVTPDGTEVWERWPSAWPLRGAWVLPESGDARRVGSRGDDDQTEVLAVDPTGRYVAVSTGQDPAVLDLTSDALDAPMTVDRPADESCQSGLWFSPTRLLLNCSALREGATLSVVATAVVVDVSSGYPVVTSTREYPPGEPYPATAVRVADGVFAARIGEDRGWPGTRCPGVVWFDGEGRATAPLSTADDRSTSVVAAVDGFLYTTDSGCGSGGLPGSVTRHDPRTGESTVVLTRPVTDLDGPGIGEVVVAR